jgi:hypothetical protein
MVNLTSTLTAVIGFAALTSAVPTLEKRAVTCRDDLDASRFGKVSSQVSETGQPREPEVTNRCPLVAPIAGQRSRRMHQLFGKPWKSTLRSDCQRPKLLPSRQHANHRSRQERQHCYLELVSPFLSFFLSSSFSPLSPSCLPGVGLLFFLLPCSKNELNMGKLISVFFSSPSQNVARGAGLIMDRCTRPSLNGSPELTIKGANEAWGNGNLLVDIRSVPQ